MTEQRERERERERVTVDLSLNNPKQKKIANCIIAHLAQDGNWIERRQAKSNGVVSFVKKKRDIHFVGNISPINKRQNPNQGRVYMVDGISPTLTGMEGGGRQPHIIVRSAI